MTDDEILSLGKRRATELGLMEYRFIYDTINEWTHGYSLKDIHLILGSATEVFSQPKAAPDIRDNIQSDAWGNKCPDDTHRALLIGITPMKRETREERLEHLLQYIITGDLKFEFGIRQELIERAEQLLNESRPRKRSGWKFGVKNT